MLNPSAPLPFQIDERVNVGEEARLKYRYLDLRRPAVAKHLGLVALRMTDSIILPLNTTHYALELDNYLDG